MLTLELFERPVTTPFIAPLPLVTDRLALQPGVPTIKAWFDTNRDNLRRYAKKYATATVEFEDLEQEALAAVVPLLANPAGLLVTSFMCNTTWEAIVWTKIRDAFVTYIRQDLRAHGVSERRPRDKRDREAVHPVDIVAESFNMPSDLMARMATFGEDAPTGVEFWEGTGKPKLEETPFNEITIDQWDADRDITALSDGLDTRQEEVIQAYRDSHYRIREIANVVAQCKACKASFVRQMNCKSCQKQTRRLFQQAIQAMQDRLEVPPLNRLGEDTATDAEVYQWTFQPREPQARRSRALVPVPNLNKPRQWWYRQENERKSC